MGTIIAVFDSFSRVTGPALVDRINAGVEADVFTELAAALDVSAKALAAALELSLRNIRARKKPNGDETERALRVYRVFVRARDILEDEEAARNWMVTPQRALGERLPLSLLVRNFGTEEVMNMLSAIEDGGYLLKFANLFVDLPIQQPIFHHEQGRLEFVRSLIKHYDFAGRIKDGGFFSRSVSTLFPHFDLTLREIEKTLLVLSVYYGSLPKNELSNEFVVGVLAILKIRRPELFERLRKAEVTSAEFFEETGLANIKEDSDDGVSRTWAQDMFNFCLMTDDELKKASIESQSGHLTGPARMSQWLFGYSMPRQKVIPFFCGRIEQFSVAQS